MGEKLNCSQSLSYFLHQEMNLRAREALHLFEEDTYVTATLTRKKATAFDQLNIHQPTNAMRHIIKKEFHTVVMSTLIERALNHCSNSPFSETENLFFPRSG